MVNDCRSAAAVVADRRWKQVYVNQDHRETPSPHTHTHTLDWTLSRAKLQQAVCDGQRLLQPTSPHIDIRHTKQHISGTGCCQYFKNYTTASRIQDPDLG